MFDHVQGVLAQQGLVLGQERFHQADSLLVEIESSICWRQANPEQGIP